MICYKDKTFCSRWTKCATECTRKISIEEQEAAELPIAWGAFDQCEKFTKNTIEEQNKP